MHEDEEDDGSLEPESPPLSEEAARHRIDNLIADALATLSRVTSEGGALWHDANSGHPRGPEYLDIAAEHAFEASRALFEAARHAETLASLRAAQSAALIEADAIMGTSTAGRRVADILADIDEA